jgi:hypothetical protein
MSSAAALENAELLRQWKESLALDPLGQKEYDRTADSLAHSELKPDHTKWGFVIVRCVYGPASETPWAMMLELLRAHVEESLSLQDQVELLPHHEITTVEDEATLGGADSYAARRAFRAWVAADLPPRLHADRLKEYGGLAQARAKLLSNDAHASTNHPAAVMPPRWQYCIFIDQDCLRSLEKGPVEPELKEPALKILTTDWKWDGEESPTEEFVTMNWDGGQTDEEGEEVGWMYMDMLEYVDVYERLLSSVFAWHEYYERPYKGYVDC